MINEHQAMKFCKDNISMIENYDKAVADPTQTWHCHHRLELTSDGKFANSMKDLKRLEMYYYRPASELIFLTKSEHSRLHGKGQKFTDETRKKLSEAVKGDKNPHYGKTAWCKGKHLSEEHRKKISIAHKGKKRRPFTEEHRRHMSEAHKARHLAGDDYNK